MVNNWFKQVYQLYTHWILQPVYLVTFQWEVLTTSILSDSRCNRPASMRPAYRRRALAAMLRTAVVTFSLSSLFFSSSGGGYANIEGRAFERNSSFGICKQEGQSWVHSDIKCVAFFIYQKRCINRCISCNFSSNIKIWRELKFWYLQIGNLGSHISMINSVAFL